MRGGDAAINNVSKEEKGGVGNTAINNALKKEKESVALSVDLPVYKNEKTGYLRCIRQLSLCHMHRIRVMP